MYQEIILFNSIRSQHKIKGKIVVLFKHVVSHASSHWPWSFPHLYQVMPLPVFILPNITNHLRGLPQTPDLVEMIKLFNNMLVNTTGCWKIRYFGEKQMKYVVSEDFTAIDFLIQITVTCQIHSCSNVQMYWHDITFPSKCVCWCKLVESLNIICKGCLRLCTRLWESIQSITQGGHFSLLHSTRLYKPSRHWLHKRLTPLSPP